MITDPAQTRLVAARADRRAIRARALSLAGRWLASAALLSIALVLAWKFVPSPWIRAIDWWWLVAAPMLIAAAPAGLALARPVQSRRGALTLDESLSLKDRLTSAIDLHDRPPPGVDVAFAELAVRGAEALARQIRPGDAIPVRADRAWAVWPALAAIAVGAGVLVRARPPAPATMPPATKQEVKQAGEQVQAAAKVLEAIKSEPTLASPEVQRQLDAVSDIERELAAGRTLPSDARTQSARALDQLAQSIKERAQRELAAQDLLRDSLLNAAQDARPDPSQDYQSELARSLSRGDLAAARSAARELLERMPSMSADERSALANELRELANQMARQDAASRTPPTPDDRTSPSNPEADGTTARPADLAAEREANRADQSSRDRPGANDRTTPDQSAAPAPPNGDLSTSADQPENTPKPSPAEQRKEQLRRAMEEAARDLSKSDTPRDANTREGESEQRSAPSSEQPRESKPSERNPGENRPTEQNQSGSASDAVKPGETKPQAGDRATESPRPQTTDSSGVKPDRAQHERREQQERAQPSQDQATKQGDKADRPSQGAGEPGRPDPNGEKSPRKNDADGSVTSKPDSIKPDSADPGAPKPDGASSKEPGSRERKPGGDKADAAREGERPSQTDSPGVQKLADTLREAEEAQNDAARNSMLADRMREQAMKMLENASPEEIAKAADAAREFAKRAPKPDHDSASPEMARKMLEQAEQLMKNATPEQKQRLQELARKMAEKMPDDNGENGGNTQDSRDAARRAADEFMKNATPEDMKRLSDLARSLGLDRAGGHANGDRPGDGPGRDRGPPRAFGESGTEPVDLRDRKDGTAPTPIDRVISDWFDPTGKPGDRSNHAGASGGADVLRRAAQGAERSIEQQVVPPQQGEYVRRVFRRYLQRTQGGTAPATPTSTPPTPDAPDAPKK